MERRLAAILAADVVGYSRLMGKDESGTHAGLQAHRRELFAPKIAEYHGRIVKHTGDGALVEFASAVNAVEFAVEFQRAMAERNASMPGDRRLEFRIGINLGDVIVEGEDIYGDGVNVAARLEGLADPGGICVARNVFNQVRNKVDLHFDDLGEHKVKNIAEPVQVYGVTLDGGLARARGRPRSVLRSRRMAAGLFVLATIAALTLAGLLGWRITELVGPSENSASADDPVLALPSGPSIAVLPFLNLSGDPEQEYFADGMTEEIITALTRFRELFVIAGNTTFQYKGKALDTEEVGKKLGIDYVLEGSVRKSGKRVRINAQLIDIGTGGHVWAESYDRELEDIFEVQDELTGQIAGTLGGQYGKLAEDRLKRKSPTKSVQAYDFVLRSLKWWHSLSSQAHSEARDYLEKAVELDPDYAQAHAQLSNAYLNEYVFKFNPQPNPVERAGRHAEKAVELDPSDSFSRYMLARYYFFSRQLDKFMVQANKAIELNPNEPTAIAELGFHMTYSGLDKERGLALVKKAMAINPAYPGWFHFPFAYENYMKRNYEEALSHALKINTPGFYRMYFVLAMTYGQLGRNEEAQAALAKMLELKPILADDETARDEMRMWNFPEPVIDHFMEGLHMAGFGKT